ncbi:UDP-N-acetylmuramate--L-alanine ligase [Cesiribacter andamanensis]|uniref:UDP-N-acetylmuramate--L-alanine ligase n=1 Tax=Cesiribacter andamanensis AMV16 TaxID=1279009 RepID=M7N8K3_9BACT|nr:UDP-N-acetylmuramate--L-alanine ligase [Cesiribacter andamanensis]EMR03546.1 UDP-N-acetylmuramate--L-alanine ligase [Cesiribacter andamanensis AMV16]
MSIKDYHIIYFLGVGGIGMSALARWFRTNGYQVAGYDRTPTPLTEALQSEGIAIGFEDSLEALPAAVKEDKAHTLVILTPAVPARHAQLNWLKEQGYTIKKRAEVLGMLTHSHHTAAVAGTHGKTTTSSMIAHLLKDSGTPCSAFLGGIAANYGSNLILHEGPEDPIVVAEADEFDRSFLWLEPELAVVTATDADHLDIYGEADAVVEAFRQFVGKVLPGGTAFINTRCDASLLQAAGEGVRLLRYGLEQADCQASQVWVAEGAFYFHYQGLGHELRNLELGIPGFHNVENAVAAISVALSVGVGPEAIRRALKSYRGVKRRFELVYKGAERVLIDDYAHHPEEIRAFLTSVRALYPGKKISVIFQPHLYTRTRDFHAGFAQALSLADEVILTNIYPAREEPLEGIESHIIYNLLTAKEKQLVKLQEVKALVEAGDFDVLLTVGAGDIDRLIPDLKRILEQKEHSR